MVSSPQFFLTPCSTYHVPSVGVFKQLTGQSPNDDFIFCHPYSQSLIETSHKEAMVLRLYEDGFSTRKIAELARMSEIDVRTLLTECENLIRSLCPREIIKYDMPTSLWLITDLRCNMKCRYCYTASGSFNLNSITKTADIYLLKQALDKLISIFPSIGVVEIFGGGEPLLSFNAINSLVKYADLQGYDLKFTIVTNATLINKDVIDFLESYRINITLSIDGPRLVHGINRVFPDGKGSYHVVSKSTKLLVERDIPFVIQATYTPDTFNYGFDLADVVEYLSRYTPFILIKPVEYMPSIGAGMDSSGNTILGGLLVKYVKRCFDELKKDAPNFYDITMTYALSYVARKAAKVVACPFTAFITLFPDGKLRLCHMLLDYELGSVKTRRDVLKKKYDRALSMSKVITDKLDLRDAWMFTIQDICPGELYGGLMKAINISKRYGRLRVPPPEKTLISAYWDSFLTEICKSLKEGTLDKVYRNVEYLTKRYQRRGRSD